MAQAPDPHDPHARHGLHFADHDGIPHRRAAAHQRRRVLVAERIGDLEEEGLAPDGVRRERALVQIGVSVELALGTERLPTRQALLAAPAAVVLVAPADPVAFLQVLGARAGGLDHPCAFVAERHVGLHVVHVRKAHARVGDAHEDRVALEVIAVGGGFFDGAIGGAFVHGKIEAHCCPFPFIYEYFRFSM